LADIELSDELRIETREAWQRYVDLLAPFRPELHRYCRRLTGNVWDAEDLLQDTLLRGFATLACVHSKVDNPRGYLVRIATHLWIDWKRRSDVERDHAAVAAIAKEPSSPPPRPWGVEARHAAARLIERLPHQERAALVLKDVFEMSLRDIAATLGTTLGAVKAALHRGRGRLRSPESAPVARALPSPALVDRFVELLAAGDLKGLLALMLDNGTVEMPGSLVENGRRQFERTGSWFWQSVHVHPELPAALRPQKWSSERGTFEGEPVMLSFSLQDGRKRLMAVTRFEQHGGRLARVRAYCYSPETVREVGDALGLEVGAVPYRFQGSAGRKGRVGKR
jgi:RNA polymerase sigma-70 factor (ECF subfamily)